MDDFTGPRERSDLGFVTFDLMADIFFCLSRICSVLMLIIMILVVIDCQSCV